MIAVGLAPLLPESLCLGMEIRTKVTEYVRLRVLALREKHPGQVRSHITAQYTMNAML